MRRLFRLLVATALLLSQNTAFADLTQYQTYPQQQQFEYSNFTKLLSSNSSPYQVPEGQGLTAQNLRANLSVGALAKRLPMTLIGTDGSTEITSLYRYYNSNGSQYTIDTNGPNLNWIQDVTGTVTNLGNSFTSGKRWQFVTYKNDLIGMNGFDNAQKWDGISQTTANTAGSRTANHLTADLGAPFAVQATGTNLTASRWYQYKTAFYNGTSLYWYSQNRSNPILTGTSVQNLSLSDIPLGVSGVTERILFRTTGQTSLANVLADTTYYPLAVIADNATRTYTDNITDTALVANAGNLPTWSTVTANNLSVTVPHGAICLIYQELLWIAGDPSNGSFLYYSQTLNPDWFDLIGYEQIRPDDGDKITFVLDYLGILTIGKTNTISKLYTNNASPANWTISDPFSFIGCPAPYTALTTPLGIFYLGRDGIYQFTGQTSQIVSDVVTDKIRDINQTNINDAAAVFFHNEYHLAYTSSASGSAFNNQVLTLDTIRNAYDVDTENVSSWAVLNSGTDFGALYSGSSSNGQIYVQNAVPNVTSIETLNQLQAGSVNWTDIGGTQFSPTLSLGWGCNWATIPYATWSAFPPQSTWTIQSQLGTWISAPIQINASYLNSLTWNPILGAGSNIGFQLRTASTSSGLSSASWSSTFYTAAGSNVSAVSANVWIQFKAIFTTTDWVTSPELIQADNYVIQLSYQPLGTNQEPAYLTLYTTGFSNWGHPGLPKRIRSVDVYYTGTSGTINMGFNDSDGDINISFPIDLTQIPPQPTAQKPFYKGSQNGIKMYHFEPPFNSALNSSPTGQDWQMTINETSTSPWTIERVVVSYDVLNKQTQ